MKSKPELHPLIWQYGKKDIIKKTGVSRVTLNRVLREQSENVKALEGLIWFFKEQQLFFDISEVQETKYKEIEDYVTYLNERLKEAKKKKKENK